MVDTMIKNDTMRGVGAFGRLRFSTIERMQPIAIVMLALTGWSNSAIADAGDAARGEQVFRACAACHSLEPDRNMTGPSLSGLWNRKAGSLPGFKRYSPALPVLQSPFQMFQGKLPDELCAAQCYGLRHSCRVF